MLDLSRRQFIGSLSALGAVGATPGMAFSAVRKTIKAAAAESAAALSTLEKAAAVVYERHFHPPESQSQDWLTRCLGQTRAGLDELTRRLSAPYACGTNLSHADVMITTLIWYMQDRMDDCLSPTAHAPLIALAQHCETLPAFRAAALSAFETMPK